MTGKQQGFDILLFHRVSFGGGVIAVLTGAAEQEKCGRGEKRQMQITDDGLSCGNGTAQAFLWRQIAEAQGRERHRREIERFGGIRNAPSTVQSVAYIEGGAACDGLNRRNGDMKQEVADIAFA
nr:hypothetical protein [Rhodophyticola porphyridii]